MYSKYFNKKAVHPVVAVSLLLVVTVISVTGFMSWFTSFSTTALVDVEEQSAQSGEDLKVETLVGDKLYVNSKDNVSIVSVQVDGTDCNIVGSYKGTNGLDISSCLQNITKQNPEVIINTGNKLITSYIYVDEIPEPTIPTLSNIWNYTLLTNYNDYMGAEDLDIDSNDNILVTGTANLQATGADFFTIKFNPSGTMLWNHTENEASDNGRGIAINSVDDVIVGGMTTNFGASWNFYGLWFDKDRIFYDKTSFDGGSTDRMYDIEVDNLDNVIMAGEMYDGSQYDLKILKYNKSLAPVWNRTVDLPVTIRNFRFEVGPNNNYYFSGRFDNGTDDRMFLTKYNAAGTQLWNTTGAKNASIDLQDVAIDNSENVYFPAKYAPTQDIVITKFDINGDQVWNYTRASGHTEGLKSSTIGPNGNIFSIGNTNINGNYDILVLEITPSGTFVNDYVLDFGSSDSGKDLMFDSTGDLIIIGRQDLGSETSYIVSKYSLD
jgi:FlaG/FlaF family flagellin (archaellin)